MKWATFNTPRVQGQMIDRRWSRTQCRCERKWHLIYVRSVGSAGHRPPIWSHVKPIIISTIRAVYISMTMPRVRLWAISQSLEPNNQLSEHRTWSRPLRNFAQNSLGFFYTWIIRYFTFKGETKCTLIRHSITLDSMSPLQVFPRCTEACGPGLSSTSRTPHVCGDDQITP